MLSGSQEGCAGSCPSSRAVPTPILHQGVLVLRQGERTGSRQGVGRLREQLCSGGAPVSRACLMFRSWDGCSVLALSSLEGEEVLREDGPVCQRPVNCLQVC